MNRYRYNDLIIEVLDEPTYTLSSTNNFSYSKQYFGVDAKKYPTSAHGIKIYNADQIIDSCIVIASGGATGIHSTASLLDNDHLLLCCSDTVFCLILQDLELKWKVQADQGTCFQIFKQHDDYITHGEVQVTKLDKDGNIKWEFGGGSLLVSIDNDEEFKIESDGIIITDFSNTKYKIDFNGKLIYKV